jgi:phosphatidate phosphatase LPIN
MREVVDHYFPPVSTLVKGGGEEFTDFTYWRDTPLDLEDFSGSDDDYDKDDNVSEEDGDEEEYDDEGVGEMGDSYISRDSVDENGNSILSGSALDEEEEDDALTSSMLEADEELAGEQLTPGLEALEGEDENTQVLSTSDENRGPNGEWIEDADAEIITGMKGIALIGGDAQPK